jgi:uncharacterized protein YegP (UPF0339 family)
MATGRVGDPPAPLDPERRGDPRTTLSGKAPSTRFEIYEADDGSWAWRLLAANDECVAYSLGPFEDEEAVRRGIRTVISVVGAAQLAYGEPQIEVVSE